MAELTSRPYADADAAEVAGLLDTIDAASGQDGGHAESQIRQFVANRVVDPGRNSRLVAAPDGTLVAVGMVVPPPATGVRVTISGGVHPLWRGRGIGREQLAWQLERAEAVRVERAGDSDWQVEVGVSTADPATCALLERNGLRPVRYFHQMRATLRAGPDPAPPDPAPPDPSLSDRGLRVVAFTGDLMPALYHTHVTAFADLWGFQQRPLAQWVPMTVGAALFRADLSRVALRDDRIVGYVLAYDAADGIDIGQVGTLPGMRRRGVAGGLLGASLAAAARAGKTHAMLLVDADSPTGAPGVYRRAGFATRHILACYRRPLGALSPTAIGSTEGK